MSKIKNRVRVADVRTSTNFFQSDVILHQYLKKYIEKSAYDYMQDKWQRLGQKAAKEMDDLSLTADKCSPILKKRNKWGEHIDEIAFHPAYYQMTHIAAESEMFFVNYNDTLRKKFAGNTTLMGFAAGYLFAMSEMGLYCPLCMTDGAAHLVDQYAPKEIRAELLPRLSSKNGDKLFTGAMFLTEKSGGSDVGRNLTKATHKKGNTYFLNGEKWFCSNANAEVMMVLARTGKLEEGTRGLSLFLVKKILNDGRRNSMEIIRLKEKMGVRSMATAEIKLKNTEGILLGEEGKGFKLMARMINISRIYNSVAAIAGSRRALVEAYEYLNHRVVFGKKAIEHALIRQKFYELGSLHLAGFLLVFRAIRAMDHVKDSNDEREKALLRVLTPMAKWWSAERGVYITRECMELMGGNGYIEDFIMPKLFRDINVLPIWEGSGNVIVLDILRAIKKTDGLKYLINFIEKTIKKESSGSIKDTLLNNLSALQQFIGQFKNLDKDQVEATAKPVFKKMITLYQIALMYQERASNEEALWIGLALSYMLSNLDDTLKVKNPPSSKEIDKLIGWKY